MTLEDLKAAKDRRPFVPFRIVVAGGESIPIDDPFAVAWHPQSPRLVIAMVNERLHWIDPATATIAAAIDRDSDRSSRRHSPRSRRLSTAGYEKLVDAGILPENNRFELIEGRIVEKNRMRPSQVATTERMRRQLERSLPPRWYVREEKPVRIPGRRSEPEPDLAVVRGEPDDYAQQHPGPGDIALVVEVSRTSVAKDRRLAPIYAAAGIPTFWIIDLERHRIEVYQARADSTYLPRAIIPESGMVDLVLDGQVVGRIAVADLLP